MEMGYFSLQAKKKKKELCDSQLNPGLGKNIGDN